MGFLPHPSDRAGLGSGNQAPGLTLEPVSKPERSEAVLSERPQCLIVDGHPIVRLGVRRALQDSFDIEEATCREEAVELVRDVGSVDVAILDMRRWSGNDHPEPIGAIDAIKALLRSEPTLGIVAHGDRAERHLASAALQAGASAYVSRTAGTEQLTSRRRGRAGPGTLR